MSDAEQHRRHVIGRLVRQGAEESQADLEFWQQVSPEDRVLALWDMVLELRTLKGLPGMNRDFRDLLSAFSTHEVRFLIVGGYAVAFHARPRFTKDLDLWVEPATENSVRTWNALRAFGAPMSGVTPADFRADVVYQVGVPPNRVDVLTELPGVSFTDAWSRRVPSRYGDVPVHYLSREDLITNKRTVGRPQDLLDVDALERRRD